MATKQVHGIRADLYGFDKKIELCYKTIQREFSQPNVDLISKYDTAMVTDGLGKAARVKHLQTLISLTRMLRKDWLIATKTDFEKLTFEIMNQFADSLGKETYYSFDHKKVLKIFVRWYKFGSRSCREVGNPPEIKSIRLKLPKNKLVREQLISDPDRIKLLHACGENLRDKAFIDVHLEAGTRPGEFLTLQIKHVKQDDYGAIIAVDGKTNARPIRLIRSTPNLFAWLAVHPYRNNPEAPLWISLDRASYGNQLLYVGARRMIIKRARTAELSKRIYLNLFRHSEITETANFMTESQLRKRHGWTNDSKMPANYVHLVNADVDDVMFKQYGIVKDAKKLQLPQKCIGCSMINPVEADRCSSCGKALTLEAAIAQEETDKKKADLTETRLTNIEETLAKIVQSLTDHDPKS